MHTEQKEFFTSVRNRFPDEFKSKYVLESGSLNVNGTIRDLFSDCKYIGIDIAQGRDVDIVCKTHEFESEELFDVVASAEQMEHDAYWKQSLAKLYQLCKPGGLVVLSAASNPRPEHGTLRTGSLWGTHENYYMNIEEEHIREALPEERFSLYEISFDRRHGDIYFVGRKK